MCESLGKIFLIVLNVLFFIAGAALLILGIIALVNEDLLYEITELITGTLSKVIDNVNVVAQIDLAGLIKTNAIILLVIGIIIFAIGFLGMCGALRKNGTMLKIYATIVLIILMAEIGLGVYAFMEAEKFESAVQDGMKLALYKTYKNGMREQNIPGVLNASQAAQEISLDLLQIEMKCCGVSNITEWQDESAIWNNTYEITFSGSTAEILMASYPPSCCKLDNEDAKSVGFQVVPVSHFTNLKGCMDATVPGVKLTTPCYERLKDVIKANQDIIIITLVIIAIVEILAVICACFCIKDD